MVFKERKRDQVEREGVGEKRSLRVGERKGKKGVTLQKLPATCRYPGIMGLFLGLQRREDWNSAPPESEFEFSPRRR